MEFNVGNSPELAEYILACFTNEPEKHPDVLANLTRTLWNSLNYRVAKPFEEGGAAEIIDGTGKHFVYDKKTQLVFFNVSGGTHQLLISYFAALHQTDFSKDTDGWFTEHFMGWNAQGKLVDYYIGAGLGLFESTVGGQDRIWASRDIEFNSMERQVFRRFAKFDPND